MRWSDCPGNVWNTNSCLAEKNRIHQRSSCYDNYISFLSPRDIDRNYRNPDLCFQEEMSKEKQASAYFMRHAVK